VDDYWDKFLKRVKNHAIIVQAARDLLTAIYATGSPQEIQELLCYPEIEELELALTKLDT